MLLGVQSEGMRSAAAVLLEHADLLAAQRAVCRHLSGAGRDPGLRAGLAAMADLVADVGELLADDLALLASRVRDGAVVYERVESAAAKGFER